MPPRKRLLFFLLIGLLTVAVGVIPDLVSDELKAWCLQHLGPSYPWYFIGFFVVGCFALLAVSGDFKDLLPFNRQTKAQRQIKIAWSQETKHHLQTAKEKLKDAQPEETIKALSHLKNAGIDEQLNLLSIRLAQHQRDSRLGTLSSEQKDTAFNRIAKDLLDLIKAIESQLAEGEKENQQLREAFRQRYRDRLTQKLASRQPVNLRRLTSKEGTSERVAATFVPYNSEEIKEEIGKTFQAAHGRLLIVGQPGAGKTTLLLQLADRLFDLEADALPVVVNLATWQSSYGKLETWLEAVLAAELGTNKAGAKAVLRQSGLILLLDGLDELKEDEAMNSCLAAIADFGATPGRRFVITCRIEEYKRVPEDARVNLQIEVGPLTGQQLEAELTRMGREQPEAIPLLQAIQKDPLLRQAVETPFYFNTLQLLFAGRLPVFRAEDLDGRKEEIKELFVAAALQNTQLKKYPPERARHWLAFLADRMNHRNKVIFELLDLQYDWWESWRWNERSISKLLNGLILGLIYGLYFGVFCGLLSGLTIYGFFGLTFCVALGGILGGGLGLILALLEVLFLETFLGERQVLGRFKRRHLYGGLAGIFVGVLIKDLLSGLIFGWLFGQFRVPKFNLMPRISTVERIQWSIIISWKNLKKNALMKGILWFYLWLLFGIAIPMLLAGLLSGVLTVLIFGVLHVFTKEYSGFIQISTPYQRFQASAKVFRFSILQHFHLRYLLHKKGALPLDLVDFLTEMSARHLLETDGATWRFRHRIIQDYFAGQWVEPYKAGAKHI